jgi:hypothetical protein
MHLNMFLTHVLPSLVLALLSLNVALGVVANDDYMAIYKSSVIDGGSAIHIRYIRYHSTRHPEPGMSWKHT